MNRILTAFAFVFFGLSWTYGQTCDTLRNYNPSNLSIITSDNGYLHGNDQIGGNNILSWAEQYTVAGPIQLRSLRFLPVRVSNGGGSVTFNVYNDNAGQPGSVVYTQTETLGSINELFWTTIEMNTPPTLNGTYWVGYDVSYINAADTFALAGNYNMNNSSNDTYFFESGTWQDVPSAFVDNNNDPLGSAFALDLLLSNDPDPVASFTGNGSACLGGGQFNLDGSGSSFAGIYEWVLQDNPFTANIDTDSGVTGTLIPNTPTSVTSQVVGLFVYGGCRTDNTGFLVNVYNPVSATVTPSNTTCGNNNGQIVVTNQQGGTGSAYTYSLNGTTYQGSNTFSGLAPGAYTVYVRTNGDACETTYNVTVGATPPETITVGTNQTICAGNNATITASGNGTIEWFDGATSLGTGGSLSVSPGSNTTYTAVLTDANTCTDSDQVSVTVNPNPTVNAGTDQSICTGSSANLNATGSGASFQWFEAATPIGSNASINVSPTSNTTYTVQNTDGNGCTSTDNITVTVNPLPTVNSGADETICDGDNVTLNATGTGSTFEWFIGGTTIGNNASISVNPSTNTTYTVQNTDGNGCVNTDNLLVTVNPTPTVNAGADETICDGESVTLTASGSAPTYEWFDGGTSLGNNASLSVSPNANTIYTVVNTAGNGCSISDNVSVNVNPLPTVSAGTDFSICVGDDANLSATGSGSTFEWFDGGTSVGNTAALTTTPIANTTYTVENTDGNGCTNSDDILVTVNQYDDASFTFNNFCEGSSNSAVNIATNGGTFSFTSAPGDGATINPTTGEISNGILGTTYSVDYTTSGACPSTSTETTTVQSQDDPSFTYDDVCIGNSNIPYNIATPGGTFDFTPAPGDGATIDAGTGIISNPVQGNSYTIEYTTPAGVCQSVSTETVAVFVAPTVTASGDETICDGDQVTISASGASTYEWDNSLGAGATQDVSPTVNTTYEVTGTDVNGCTGTDQVTVSVNPLPAVDAGLDQEVCEEGEITLTATGADTYNWDNGLGNGESHTVTPPSTTTYTVTGTDGNNCQNTDQIIVTVFPGVGVSGIVTPLNGGNNGEIDITVSGGDGNFTYAWSNGETTEDLTGLAAGTYTVIVTDGNGCEAEASFVVDDVTGIHEISTFEMKVFPNPADQSVSLQIENVDFEYTVVNTLGKIVQNGSGSNEVLLNTSQLEAGVYFINVSFNETKSIVKFVVQH